MIRQPPTSTLFPTRRSSDLVADATASTRCRKTASAQIPLAETRRSEEHTSELQSRRGLVWRLLLEKKKKRTTISSNLCPAMRASAASAPFGQSSFWSGWYVV